MFACFGPSKELLASEKAIRIRDAIAISGAALAFHLPALGSEVAGIGLSREIVNYTRGQRNAPPDTPEADHLDVADGGFYNNLGVESLINRGCGYIIVVDAEYDPESKHDDRSGQQYHGLRTLLKRNHIKTAFSNNADAVIKKLDAVNKPLHVFRGNETIPDILYIKLKSWDKYDEKAAKEPYNKPGFLDQLFGGGEFTFDPQFSTAKLDYGFAEHRNLSELGTFIVTQHKKGIESFVAKSK